MICTNDLLHYTNDLLHYTFQQLADSLAINSVDRKDDFVLLRGRIRLDGTGVKPLYQETSEVFGAEEVCERCLLACLC